MTFTGFNEAQAEKKKKKTDRKTETNPWAEHADFMIVMGGGGPESLRVEG